MATPIFVKQSVPKSIVVNGNETIVTAIPCGINPYDGTTYAGADSTTSVPKGGGFLCSGISMANIPIENLFTEQLRSMGKNAIRFSSGQRINAFDFTFEGGDIRTLKILGGIDPSSASISAYKFLPDMGLSCHLIVRKWQPAQGIVVSYLIPNLSMMFAEVGAGGEADTRGTQVVQFYSESGEVWALQGNTTFSYGYWKTNGINAAAPNGVLVDFVIGTGNAAATTSPVPLLINDSVNGASSSNYKRYFFGVWVNGVLQTDAQVSYTTGTRTLTFTTAPATGASLLALYVNDWSSVFPENWSNSGDSVTVTNENTPWQDYA